MLKSFDQITVRLQQKQNTLLSFDHPGNENTGEGAVRVRPRDGERHRVLGTPQRVRDAPGSVEQRSESFPDTARPRTRFSEQQKAVGVPGVPRCVVGG